MCSNPDHDHEVPEITPPEEIEALRNNPDDPRLGGATRVRFTAAPEGVLVTYEFPEGIGPAVTEGPVTDDTVLVLGVTLAQDGWSGSPVCDEVFIFTHPEEASAA